MTRYYPLMYPEYFETRFKLGLPTADLPAAFAIVTAYQTTGKEWSFERNQEATHQLQAELEQQGSLLGIVTGYSPRTGHAEPGTGGRFQLNWPGMPFRVSQPR